MEDANDVMLYYIIMSNKSKEIIKLLNNSHIAIEINDCDVDAVYNAATERGMLRQLHALYGTIAPSDSKLKPRYHHLNLKSALQESDSNDGLKNSICQHFWDYRINFGRKILIIDQISDSNLAQKIKNVTINDFVDINIYGYKYLDNDAPDADVLPLKVVAKRTTEDNSTVIILHEAVSTFEYVQPPEQFLTDAGMEFINSMKLKKRIITHGFHKIVVNNRGDLRIALIDPTSLGSDAAFDKYNSALNYINNEYFGGKSEGTRRPVSFFSTIQKSYENENIGRVISGCFYTSSGSRYINSSRGAGTDLRSDPFQLGGQEAEQQKLEFVKLTIDWPDFSGKPEVSLNGSSEMFLNPEKSLRYMEVLFSTDNNDVTSFIQEVIENATW